MATLFISDLHLSAEREEKTALFERFLTAAKSRCDGLYILGDLFEFWLGDDDDSDPHPRVVSALADFSGFGIPLYIMRGNRDFLLGDDFMRATGAALLPDYQVENLYGVSTLMAHGDLLCTKDVEYQEFRRQVRNPENQQSFLSKSLEERRAIAAHTRSGTTASMLKKDGYIMDVEPLAVAKVMAEYKATRLIHGHTHRPGVRQFVADGLPHVRVVLGDWYEQENVAVVNTAGTDLFSIIEFLNS